MPEVISSSIKIGAFQLTGTLKTVDDLLTKLEAGIPNAFANHQLTMAFFTPFAGEHWGTLVFHKYAFTWELGVQFYRYPSERGKDVVARIRYGGSPAYGARDPQDLGPLVNDIYKAMLEAVEL